jgi:transcriptional repressor NrdR
VVDTRATDDGAAIRRRRECLACGYRFTTFERVEEQPFVVLKRSGDRMPFDAARVREGVAAAAKGRPVSDGQLAALAQEIEDELRLESPEVTTERIGRAVLDRLRVLDEVTYVRFASVYKGFDEAEDFARELRALTKSTEPKRH